MIIPEYSENDQTSQYGSCAIELLRSYPISYSIPPFLKLTLNICSNGNGRFIRLIQKNDAM